MNVIIRSLLPGGLCSKGTEASPTEFYFQSLMMEVEVGQLDLDLSARSTLVGDLGRHTASVALSRKQDSFT